MSSNNRPGRPDKGSSPELMPSIMGAFDAYIGTKNVFDDQTADIKTSTPKRTYQASNFAHLSPNVQKILSNVPEQEISKKFSSEETLGPRRFGSTNRLFYRSMRTTHQEKAAESVEYISSNVQKMLSNLPDTELIIRSSNLSVNSTSSSTKQSLSRNSSYLFSSRSKQYTYHSDSNSVDECDKDGEKREENDGHSRPLGSYLHSYRGVASRTPVGRKNMGKYLQVPSDGGGSSDAATPPTASTSTVSSGAGPSRPVSLTSLGSCSSSGSGGGASEGRKAGTGTEFAASAESLADSDPEPAGRQGSADSGIAEQEQSPMTPEQRVLQEVLDTETVYVADLKEVIQGYLDPWRSDPDCPLAEHLPHLFSNLEEIYNFNKSFLDDLCNADCDPAKIANLFIQNDRGFHVYEQYCTTNYPRTMEILGKLQRDEETAPMFRERQLALGHALPLGSYLLKPVQRILKYHLLLQRLSKQCEQQHKPTVDLALTTMTAIASSINNMKRKHEHAVRVQEIQSQLYGWPGADLTTFGELIAEGTFRVQGARGRRHVFLFEKMLLLAKNKQEGALAYKTHIMCSNLMLVEQVRGEPLSFQVLPFDNPRLQCTFRARSPQHKREWTLQIKRVILENYSAVIPNHARQLVMQLGQDLQETDDIPDRWSPMKHTTPYYLERRSRVRKSRDFSNRRASSQDRSFSSLTNWRRKSEPSMVPQYNSKTVPKKISKLKKSRELSCSTFYTDFSDSEGGETVAESTECLTQPEETRNVEQQNVQEEPIKKTAENNLEKIVSDLLMQNQEFSKVLNREQTTRHPRRNINSEPGPLWDEDRPKLPDKADSLPRSFQLNDQFEKTESTNTSPVEQHENDLCSQAEDNQYPEHRIYRKSAIRLSILQRLRMIISEEQKNNSKYTPVKQGSKSMGEKIAHPDYADPHKLFVGSRNLSSMTLSNEDPVEDIMGEKVELDLSFNENEVLNELEKRLNSTRITENEPDTGQKCTISSHNGHNSSTISHNNSSQKSDSYYESILENSLTEEYVRDKDGKLVAKQDSFNNYDKKPVVLKGISINSEGSEMKTPTVTRKPAIRRPTKAPPPIPVKPQKLINNPSTKKNFEIASPSSSTNSNITGANGNETKAQTSWVKAIVGRFE